MSGKKIIRGLREAVISQMPAANGKVFHLSVAPPSLNNAYRNAMYGRGGRFKSPQYTQWIKAAAQEIALQRPAHIAGDFGLEIEIGRDLMAGDLDNRIKPLSDLLVSCHVVEDDVRMVEVTARKTGRADVKIRVYRVEARAA